MKSLLAIVLTLTVPDYYRDFRVHRAGREGFGRSSVKVPDQADFSFATSSGVGLPYTGDMCDQLTTAEKALGGYWCLSGDGTSPVDSTKTFAVNSGATATTTPVCPNGPDCAEDAITLFTSTGYYTQSAAAAATNTPFTACVLYQADAIGGNNWVTHATNIFDFSWELGAGFGDGTPQVGVFDGATADYAAMASGNGAVGIRFFCGTWAPGDHIRAYVNGALVATSPLSLASRSTTSKKVTIGGQNGGGGAGITWGFYGAFFVESQLSAARLLAISHAVLADNPTSVQGGAMTFSRSGTGYFCENEAHRGSFMISGRPCIAQGGIYINGPVTNRALYSEAFDTAATWVPTHVTSALPTVTANHGVGPAGRKTAERLVTDSCNGVGDVSDIEMAYTGTAAATTVSVYLKGTSTSGNVLLYLYDDTAAAGTGTNCAYTETEWTRCQVSRTMANTTHRMGIGCNNLAAIDFSTDTGVGDVLVWGAQSETGTAAMAYVPNRTTGTSSSATDRVSFVSPSITNGWSASLTIKSPDRASSGAPELFYLYESASNYGDAYMVYGVTPTCRNAHTAGGVSKGIAQTNYIDTGFRRLACAFNGADTITNYPWDTASGSTTGTTAAIVPTEIWLGSLQPFATSGSHVWIKDVCVDSNPGTCR